MDTDLIDWLRDVANSFQEDPDVKAMAARLYNQWESGIIPSPKAVNEIRKLKKSRRLCARLNEDGSCDWLRKNAAIEQLVPPKPGERIYCHRRRLGTFEGCTGFRELKGDMK